MCGDKFGECGNKFFIPTFFIFGYEILFFQNNDGDCCNDEGYTGCNCQ